jgi:L-lactate dehydrogenase complex protein LldG
VSAREEILARIRAANATGRPAARATAAGSAAWGLGTASDAEEAPVSAAGSGADGASAAIAADGNRYRPTGSLHGAALLDLLAARLSDYRAIVRRAPPDRLGEAVGAALTRRSARRIAVPPGLELPGLPDDVEAVAGDGLAPDVLAALDGVVTGAAVAIAETGTIVLDSSPGQGTRAVTLVPDYHLCIVHADQVVHSVPEAVGRLAPRATRPLTWISGPSATSDIELNRVEGVHGPRDLEVVIVAAANAAG